MNALAPLRIVPMPEESITALARRQHEERLSASDADIASEQSRINAAEKALEQAQIPAQQLMSLQDRRSAIIAASFTGDDPQEDSAALDAQIKMTIQMVAAEAAKIQGATAAVATIRERLDELQRRRAVEMGGRQQVLFAQAHEAVMDYRSALEDAAKAYDAAQARFLGLLCARDHLRPASEPPASAGMSTTLVHRAPTSIPVFEQYGAPRQIVTAVTAIAKETLQALGVDTTGL